MDEPKILIVDDEEAARYGMARALKNYSVAEAASVEAARQAVAKSRPDLILLDNNLPGASGLDYLQELAASADAPPVVMITAHGSERTAISAIKAGAYDYLAKPFDVDELRLVVKNATPSTKGSPPSRWSPSRRTPPPGRQRARGRPPPRLS